MSYPHELFTHILPPKYFTTYTKMDVSCVSLSDPFPSHRVTELLREAAANTCLQTREKILKEAVVLVDWEIPYPWRQSLHVHSRLAETLIEQGKTYAALSCAERVACIFQRHFDLKSCAGAELLHLIAQDRLLKGKYQEAEETLRKCLEVRARFDMMRSPPYLYALTGLASLRALQGDLISALRFIDEAVIVWIAIGDVQAKTELARLKVLRQEIVSSMERLHIEPVHDAGKDEIFD